MELQSTNQGDLCPSLYMCLTSVPLPEVSHKKSPLLCCSAALFELGMEQLPAHAISEHVSLAEKLTARPARAVTSRLVNGADSQPPEAHLQQIHLTQRPVCRQCRSAALCLSST